MWNYCSYFLACNNSQALVINTLWEVVTSKRAWTSTSGNSCATEVAAGGFQLPFFPCAGGCRSSHTTQPFPTLLCCSRVLHPRRGRTYNADLSQAAPRLLRPFLGRWNTKEEIQLGTPPMSLACCTPRNVAHASQLMAGMPSFKMTGVSGERALNETSQAMNTMWDVTSRGMWRVCEGLSRSGPVKSKVFTHCHFFSPYLFSPNQSEASGQSSAPSAALYVRQLFFLKD